MKPKIDKKKMVTESAPDVAMILYCLKFTKAHAPLEDLARYSAMLDKNIPKFERYVKKLEERGLCSKA